MTKVDITKCIGCGACASICPESFEMNDGKAKIKNSKTKYLKDAINSCPVNAIK